ncbi:MAG: aldehyde dehydrogenase [Collinsella sp.]|nr:aldehyde dehydrogenase [Collinsella sp.]
MDRNEIEELVERQRRFFRTHATLDVAYRRDALARLHKAVRSHEDDIAAALKEDLGKSADEGYMCEIGLSLSEIRHQRAHLRRWSRRRLQPTDLANAMATSYVERVPYGVTLIMAPWNYPFLLTLEPLAGAIAAGNCCVVKPSAYAPASSRVLRAICEESLPPELVSVVEGGREENGVLLDQRWDSIFFTGSVSVGRLVMSRAAENLTPVTLELGGKSPCIVDATADLKVAAARIAFGKWLNAGQTCVAPDYLLVDRSVKDEFVELLCEQVRAMYGDRPLDNDDYGKMVNEKHFDRVLSLIDPGKIVMGGGSDRSALKIEPTIMDGVVPGDAVMQEEIFGPVLPILTFGDLDEAEAFVTSRETPLALYIFTRDRAVERRFVRQVPFGGGCVNDTIIHLATSKLGFGGMGASGMGSYHGRKSFETFTHEKSVVRKWRFPDLPMRYQPYAAWKRAVVRFFLH